MKSPSEVKAPSSVEKFGRHEKEKPRGREDGKGEERGHKRNVERRNTFLAKAIFFCLQFIFPPISRYCHRKISVYLGSYCYLCQIYIIFSTSTSYGNTFTLSVAGTFVPIKMIEGRGEFITHKCSQNLLFNFELCTDFISHVAGAGSFILLHKISRQRRHLTVYVSAFRDVRFLLENHSNIIIIICISDWTCKI